MLLQVLCETYQGKQNKTKTIAHPIGHMTYTQVPAMCEENIFHLSHLTQPVKTGLLSH